MQYNKINISIIFLAFIEKQSSFSVFFENKKMNEFIGLSFT